MNLKEYENSYKNRSFLLARVKEHRNIVQKELEIIDKFIEIMEEQQAFFTELKESEMK